MNITINNKYRLIKRDAMNYELYEWRKAFETAATKGKDIPETWRQTGHFFSGLRSALIWLLQYRLINDPGECASIQEALEHMRVIADDLKNVTVKDD